VKIRFHGAAHTVTGSQHLLEINGHRLLLECGLFQGRRKEFYARNRKFPFNASKIDALILSHAHIDHSGNLPNLVKQGYRGPIYATHATSHLTNIMLIDSGHIQEADAAYANKRRARRGKEAEEPPAEALYTQEDAAYVAQFFMNVHYEEAFEPVPGVQARLVEAGHILGSAAVVLDIEEGGRTRRLWFSGDIGRRKLPLLRDPVLPHGADFMIMECTYGDRPHLDIDAAYEELSEVVRRTVRRGGKVIVPAFAVGRTQELVYCLNQMIRAGEIPRIPVYVDSPLAVNVTDIFKTHDEAFDAETHAFIKKHANNGALGFDLLTYTRSVEESKALNERDEPMVIISASGMAETGRILHHLRNNIEDPRSTVLIVSWQAPNTLGRRLAEQETQVKIFGDVFERRAEVATIHGFSAHGGQDFLREYALSTRESVKRIFLVHGEQKPAEALMALLAEDGVQGVSYPELHAGVEV
jgi:metallo-beta-lactamase family protein